MGGIAGRVWDLLEKRVCRARQHRASRKPPPALPFTTPFQMDGAA